ncbi:hypothetical protein V4762_00880 [Thermodesulfobium sp. 4217-1]|uniref:DUF6115 domain-containing protein n=1 Tax=Thermodesulfobium sp. 4217-1 TaxID=3120013 RepID=UPI00322167E5
MELLILLFQIVILGASIFFLYSREVRLRDIYSKLPSESEIIELESEMREILYELKDSLRRVKTLESDEALKVEHLEQADEKYTDLDIENILPKSLEQNGVYDDVIGLFNKGMSEFEICRKLSLPKGKVDLILNLEKLKKEFKGGF